MQSRMDKYNYEVDTAHSRTIKNQNLYEDVRKSSLTDFDVNSNMSVLEDNKNVISISHVKSILDDKYQNNERRRSLLIPDYETDEVVDDVTDYDTKEYDINAIIKKAKQGKTVDYNKERLKRSHEAQFEILSNLELGLKNIEEPVEHHSNRKKEEENLMDLINTITQIEKINREKYSKEVSGALDLLGLGETTETDSTLVNELKNDIKETKEETIDETGIEEAIIKEEKEEEKTPEEETLTKIDALDHYEDFDDISRSDKSAIFLKIVIFVIIVCLIAGAIYILNNLLNLGLF